METKCCSKCKRDLPKDDVHFASRYDRKSKQFQSICRECQKEYRKEHYLKNTKKYIDKAKKYKEGIVDWFIDIKKNLKCEECGEERYWVLCFHHNDPKEKESDVSSLVKSCNKKKILEEIEKCTVLCSNCHLDLHHNENAGVA